MASLALIALAAVLPFLYGESYPAAQHRQTAATWQRQLGAAWTAREIFAHCGTAKPLPAGVVPVVALPRCRGPSGLRWVWRAAERHRGPVVLRYAGEMNRSAPAAHGFIHEWRIVYRKARALAPNVRLLWSVSGKGACAGTAWRYWPGRRFVDYAGLSVFRWPGHPGSFASRFTRAYDWLASRRVPVVLAELGVARNLGDRARAAWLAGARRTVESWPWYAGALYLDSRPDADWRLDGSTRTMREWARFAPAHGAKA